MATTKKAKKKVSPRSLTTMPVSFFDINDRFKLTRLEAKQSQVEFAEALGLGVSYIKQVEGKFFTPGIHAIKQLHKVFNKSYEYIIDGSKH